MTKPAMSLLLGLLLLLLVAPAGQQTPSRTAPTPAMPTQSPAPTSREPPTPVPDALAESLLQHAADEFTAFNQNQWKELYGYLAPSAQQQCTSAQFGAWMERVPNEPPLAFFQPKLFAYEEGYAGFAEDAGLTMAWEASRITMRGNEALVYKKTTLSRLGQAISIVEAEEPDRWTLIDGQWRWVLAEPESAEFTIGIFCEMVASTPAPRFTTVPDQPGYAWANPADLGTPLTMK